MARGGRKRAWDVNEIETVINEIKIVAHNVLVNDNNPLTASERGQRGEVR
jgi:hypothetical protein